MKVIYNNIIPFKGFLAINLFGICFVRKDLMNYFDNIDINHEAIHTEQQKELLFIFFYIWYGIEWLCKILYFGNVHTAYRNISFEREAYNNEYDRNYLQSRKRYNWIKLLS